MLQRVAALGTLSEFWKIIGELNPEKLREEAERRVLIVLLGPRGSGKTVVGDLLTGKANIRTDTAPVLWEITAESEDELPELPRADLFLYVANATEGISSRDRQILSHLRRHNWPFLVVLNKCDEVDNLSAMQYEVLRLLADVPHDRIIFLSATSSMREVSALPALLLNTYPQWRLSLARKLPGLRSQAANDVIAETSRVNAEFALVSNIPANLPLIGGFIGGTADFLVLTKNQAMMLFKLAAIYGRDLRSVYRLLGEVAPVVGAAFVWRTVARELIGLLPSPLAAVPKTAIAYAGTYVVGRTAEYYYAMGSKPRSEIVASFRKEAAQRWQQLCARGTKGRASGDNTDRKSNE